MSIIFFLDDFENTKKNSFKKSLWANYVLKITSFWLSFFLTSSLYCWMKIKLHMFVLKYRWISRFKARVISKKISIATIWLNKSYWFFKTNFSCNRNETCWRSIVLYSIFVTSTNVFLSKTKWFVFAMISNKFSLFARAKIEILSWAHAYKRFRFERKFTKLRLIENMRLKSFKSDEIDRLNVAEFAQKILNIDNAIIIVIFNDDDKNWVSWRYNFLSNNLLTNLIKQVYSKFEIAFSNIEYLKQRIILVIVNIDVKRINNVCVNNLYDQIHFKYNSDKIVDSKMKKKFIRMFL